MSGRSARVTARVLPRHLVPAAPGARAAWPRLLAGALALAGTLAPAPAAAQRILGGGSDGVTLPRGAVRVGIGGETTVQRDRWNDGRLEGLGGNIDTDAFGPLQFSLLAPVEQLVQRLGVAGFGASLGRTRLDARQRAFVTPLAVEYGLSDRVTLSARASLVRTRAESQFRVRPDGATLGVNPVFLGSAVAAQNAATIGAYAAAAANLGARRDACQADPGAAPECGTILAELADVAALASRTGDFATGLSSLYGTAAVRGARYVPFAGSAAEAALLGRVDSLRTALQRYGITDVAAGTGLPAGAQLPLAARDLDRLVRDSTDGYGARALDDAALTQVGDVFIGALVKLHDSFGADGRARFAPGARGWRQAVLVEGRIGTSHREVADAFLDQGTGTGAHALTVRSITDVVWSDRLWGTLAVGYTQPFASAITRRVPSVPGQEWLEWWRTASVPVTLGGQLDVELSPRWHVNDYVALGAQWRWRRKAADRHDLVATVTSPGLEPVALDAGLLDDATRADEQRVGLTASYSTLAARARGTGGMAFEIGFVHLQSIASGAGVVPKQWEDRLVVRYYTRFLGR